MKEYTKEAKQPKDGVIPQWKMHGYVVAVHGSSRSTTKKQWLTFSIGKPGAEDPEKNFVYFAVTNLFEKTHKMAEVGDHLAIFGSIETWPDENKKFRVELVAEKILTWDEYQAKKRAKNGG